MLLTRARAEDRARAEKLLAHAAATATALGMTRLSHEVEELAKRSFGYAWSGAEVHAAK